MTFKEFKKQNNLNPKSGFSLSYDYDIFYDMAERAGFDLTKDSVARIGDDPDDYLEFYNIDLWHEIISIQDPDFTKLEELSEEAFLREYFFDKYKVESSYNDDEYGLVIKLVHD